MECGQCDHFWSCKWLSCMAFDMLVYEHQNCDHFSDFTQCIWSSFINVSANPEMVRWRRCSQLSWVGMTLLYYLIGLVFKNRLHFICLSGSMQSILSLFDICFRYFQINMYCRGWMLVGLVLVFVPALLARRNNKRMVVYCYLSSVELFKSEPCLSNVL